MVEERESVVEQVKDLYSKVLSSPLKKGDHMADDVPPMCTHGVAQWKIFHKWTTTSVLDVRPASYQL